MVEVRRFTGSPALSFFRAGRVEATADREVQIDSLLQALIAYVEQLDTCGDDLALLLEHATTTCRPALKTMLQRRIKYMTSSCKMTLLKV